MQLITDIDHWRLLREGMDETSSIGFVPTMGALHAGHLSLIKRARAENDIVVVSIFINPLQFDRESDYLNYPSNHECDVELCESYGVDYIFKPDIENILSPKIGYKIACSLPFAQEYEGKSRPGHFDGMLTIVNKLFNLIKPHNAYFGEKDFQQILLIEAMVKDFFMDIEIIRCLTIRKGKLALSSRLHRLNEQELILAEKCSAVIHTAHRDNLTQVKEKLIELGVHVEYIDITISRVFVAYHIGPIRLIDNFNLEEADVYKHA